MSVIIIGNDPAHVKNVSCKNCACRLEYVDADTRKKTVRDYTGDSDTYTIIDCPKCGHEVHVK